MRRIGLVIIVFLCIICCQACSHSTAVSETYSAGPSILPGEKAITSLPGPKHDSEISLEQTLLLRRSVRSYKDDPLTLQEVSQLLWAAQGSSDPRGFRTAPSAGALYPLEVYLIVGNVQDLAQGIYHYVPDNHQLEKVADGDKRQQLADAALGQNPLLEGAVSIVFTAVYNRTTGKYGERGIRYVHIEVGHAGQNVCLQATGLRLGAVTIGAFSDELVAILLNIPQEEKPLYIIPVGRT